VNRKLSLITLLIIYFYFITHIIVFFTLYIIIDLGVDAVTQSSIVERQPRSSLLLSFANIGKFCQLTKIIRSDFKSILENTFANVHTNQQQIFIPNTEITPPRNCIGSQQDQPEEQLTCSNGK
jgi:hypothetical protein